MPPPPPSCRYRGGSAWRCPRDLVFLAAILFLLIAMVPHAIYAQDPEDASKPEEEEPEPSRAIIFPWFAEALGIVIFYLTTRYVLVLPYTGIMFILGVFMGVGATRLGLEDHLTQSLMQWSNINYEVLLLVFLPGLVFNDSFGLDVHLFGIAFWQCIMLFRWLFYNATVVIISQQLSIRIRTTLYLSISSLSSYFSIVEDLDPSTYK